MHKLFLAAALSACASGVLAVEAPPGLVGQFRSASKSVCVEGGRAGKPTCSRVADTMTIERTPFGGNRDVKVVAEFTLPDSRICSFEGMGYWNEPQKRLVATDASTDCELSLVPVGRELRGIVIRPDQCSSPCAGRSWLEGVVLRKR